MNQPWFDEMQQELEQRIPEKNVQAEGLLDKKILALLAELGKLVGQNDYLMFESSEKKRLKEFSLTDYVQGLYCVLAIGSELGFQEDIRMEKAIHNMEQDLDNQFLHVFEGIMLLRAKRTVGIYRILFNHYLHLGILLNFTDEQVEGELIRQNG